MLEGRKKTIERRPIHTRSSTPVPCENGTFRSPNDETIMTRKPIRIRRQRIRTLQSGYCAICNLPYNNVDDHVQSKKHQKLIGEDANYIALNGYVGIESLLSLTGIDAIGFEDFSPKKKRRNMPRTRASSVVSDIVKSADKETAGHRLRSRKNINYMTPPLDDDSFQEKPDLEPPVPPVRLEYKEYRELRSSTRALAKLTSGIEDNEPEVWESGRPKRACINRQKRLSADERLVSDNKTYYKVEVLSSKLRPAEKEKGLKPKESKSSSESDKGLIVKFKKLRNSELVQLNNEASNFLFPKKDDSSEEDEEFDGTETEEEKGSATEINEISSTSEIEDVKPIEKFKVEDEASMDSITSECKRSKKRRSHAEAFIMDNQKYYKFETPGSRLRYHGSYLSPVPPKSNGDMTTKTEPGIELKTEKHDKDLEGKDDNNVKVNLDEFQFCFETVPENEKWYQTFRRQDQSEQRYNFSHNYHWNDFVLPHQIPHLRPLDRRTCYNAYKCVKELICNSSSDSKSGDVSSSSDAEESNGVPKEQIITIQEKESPVEQTDDDSKLSELSSVSDELVNGGPRRPGRKKRSDALTLSPSSNRGRNPRKSPRQHASTLAILSSLVHQRKRRSKNGEVPSTSLQTIPEESVPVVVTEQKPTEQKPLTPQRQRKKKTDYVALAAKIEEELTASTEDFDWDEFEPPNELNMDFSRSRPSVKEILRIYEKTKAKENVYSCRRFFNGAPGRKPGKRKKNLTGWPNKTKKRRVVKGENGENGANVDSEEEFDENDSITDMDDRENKCDSAENRVSNNGDANSEIRDTLLQPYVYVKKLDNCAQFAVKKVMVTAPCRRTIRRPKRMIPKGPSPKPPRILRRSKGRWYRDR